MPGNTKGQGKARGGGSGDYQGIWQRSGGRERHTSPIQLRLHIENCDNPRQKRTLLRTISEVVALLRECDQGDEGGDLQGVIRGLESAMEANSAEQGAYSPGETDGTDGNASGLPFRDLGETLQVASECLSSLSARPTVQKSEFWTDFFFPEKMEKEHGKALEERSENAVESADNALLASEYRPNPGSSSLMSPSTTEQLDHDYGHFTEALREPLGESGDAARPIDDSSSCTGQIPDFHSPISPRSSLAHQTASQASSTGHTGTFSDLGLTCSDPGHSPHDDGRNEGGLLEQRPQCDGCISNHSNHDERRVARTQEGTKLSPDRNTSVERTEATAQSGVRDTPFSPSQDPEVSFEPDKNVLKEENAASPKYESFNFSQMPVLANNEDTSVLPFSGVPSLFPEDLAAHRTAIGDSEDLLDNEAISQEEDTQFATSSEETAALGLRTNALESAPEYVDLKASRRSKVHEGERDTFKIPPIPDRTSENTSVLTGKKGLSALRSSREAFQGASDSSETFRGLHSVGEAPQNAEHTLERRKRSQHSNSSGVSTSDALVYATPSHVPLSPALSEIHAGEAHLISRRHLEPQDDAVQDRSMEPRSTAIRHPDSFSTSSSFSFSESFGSVVRPLPLPLLYERVQRLSEAGKGAAEVDSTGETDSGGRNRSVYQTVSDNAAAKSSREAHSTTDERNELAQGNALRLDVFRRSQDEFSSGGEDSSFQPQGGRVDMPSSSPPTPPSPAALERPTVTLPRLQTSSDGPQYSPVYTLSPTVSPGLDTSPFAPLTHSVVQLSDSYVSDSEGEGGDRASQVTRDNREPLTGDESVIQDLQRVESDMGLANSLHPGTSAAEHSLPPGTSAAEHRVHPVASAVLGRLRLLKVLGRGGSAKVLLVQDSLAGAFSDANSDANSDASSEMTHATRNCVYALKIIPKRYLSRFGELEHIRTEQKLLRRFAELSAEKRRRSELGAPDGDAGHSVLAQGTRHVDSPSGGVVSSSRHLASLYQDPGQCPGSPYDAQASPGHSPNAPPPSPPDIPFLIRLHASFYDDVNLYLLLDFHAGGDLAAHMQFGPVGRDRARFYLCELTEALAALHSARVIFRDLKPENVLISAEGHVVLTDLGLAKDFVARERELRVLPEGVLRPENQRLVSSLPDLPVYDDPLYASSDSSLSVGYPYDPSISPINPSRAYPQDQTFTFCGTHEYLAPEILQGDPYSYACDMWSLGVMFYEMLTGMLPFVSENTNELYRRILEEEVDFFEEEGADGIGGRRGTGGRAGCGDHWSKDDLAYFRHVLDAPTRSLLRSLLSKNPAERLSAGELRSHAFFAGIDWALVRLARYSPPFVPDLDRENPADTRNFDPVFLSESVSLHDEASEAGDAGETRFGETLFGEAPLGETPPEHDEFATFDAEYVYWGEGWGPGNSLQDTSSVSPRDAPERSVSAASNGADVASSPLPVPETAGHGVSGALDSPHNVVLEPQSGVASQEGEVVSTAGALLETVSSKRVSLEPPAVLSKRVSLELAPVSPETGSTDAVSPETVSTDAASPEKVSTVAVLRPPPAMEAPHLSARTPLADTVSGSSKAVEGVSTPPEELIARDNSAETASEELVEPDRNVSPKDTSIGNVSPKGTSIGTVSPKGTPIGNVSPKVTFIGTVPGGEFNATHVGEIIPTAADAIEIDDMGHVRPNESGAKRFSGVSSSARDSQSPSTVSRDETRFNMPKAPRHSSSKLASILHVFRVSPWSADEGSGRLLPSEAVSGNQSGLGEVVSSAETVSGEAVSSAKTVSGEAVSSAETASGEAVSSAETVSEAEPVAGEDTGSLSPRTSTTSVPFVLSYSDSTQVTSHVMSRDVSPDDWDLLPDLGAQRGVAQNGTEGGKFARLTGFARRTRKHHMKGDVRPSSKPKSAFMSLAQRRVSQGPGSGPESASQRHVSQGSGPESTEIGLGSQTSESHHPKAQSSPARARSLLRPKSATPSQRRDASQSTSHSTSQLMSSWTPKARLKQWVNRSASGPE